MTAAEWSAAPWSEQILMNVDFQADYDGDDHRRQVRGVEQANVVTSMMVEPGLPIRHRPVLDIDVPLVAIPSSTPGHWHLYIDRQMTWQAYRRLLLALGEAGILEAGYVSASIEREHSALRLPWVRK